MKNILIFKTVNEKNLRSFLESIEWENVNIDLILPHKDIKSLMVQYPLINYIGTNMDYMDYLTLSQERKITRKRYGEIWVLSSAENNFYTFGEVYATIINMRYKCMVIKTISGMEYTVNNNLKQKIRSNAQLVMIQISHIISNIKRGYDFIT